jgi:hypothetical protein
MPKIARANSKFLQNFARSRGEGEGPFLFSLESICYTFLHLLNAFIYCCSFNIQYFILFVSRNKLFLTSLKYILHCFSVLCSNLLTDGFLLCRTCFTPFCVMPTCCKQSHSRYLPILMLYVTNPSRVTLVLQHSEVCLTKLHNLIAAISPFPGYECSVLRNTGCSSYCGMHTCIVVVNAHYKTFFSSFLLFSQHFALSLSFYLILVSLFVGY